MVGGGTLDDGDVRHGDVMATTDSAIIRLRLDTSQAEADLKRFEGSAHGVTVRARTLAQQGGSSGPGGGGLMGMMRGMGMGGMGLAALGGMFAAPILGDLAGGANGLAGGLGRDVSSSMGFSRFKRWAGEKGAATDMTLSQLGGAPASKEMTLALNEINKQILGVKNKNTSDQEQWIGEKGTEDFSKRTAEACELILKAITNPRETGAAAYSTLSGAVDGMSNFARKMVR